MRGLRWGDRVVYKEWGIKKGGRGGFKYWEGVSTKRVLVNISGN